MAKTTTINKKTGQRLKGTKAEPKGMQPLLDFKRETLKSEVEIGKTIKAINKKITSDKFWNFHYYNNPEGPRERHTRQHKSLIWELWERLIRIPTDSDKYSRDKSTTLLRNGDKINDIKVYVDKPYRFGRDILRPQLHVGFLSTLQLNQINQDTYAARKKKKYERTTREKEYIKFYEDDVNNLRLRGKKIPQGPYQGYYSHKCNVEFYWEFSNTYFWSTKYFKNFPFEVIANPKKSNSSFSKHSGNEATSASGDIYIPNYHYYYNIDGENFNVRKRVYRPLRVGNISMGGIRGDISQDMSIHSFKARLVNRPLIFSSAPPKESKYAGLSKQESDVEYLTDKYYKLFKDFYGIELLRQIQIPPADDGLFITNIRTGKKLNTLKTTYNCLYCLAQIIVRSRYYYNPSTNEPDLNYLNVEKFWLIP